MAETLWTFKTTANGYGWREQQEILLHYLQSSNLHSLRLWVKERGQDYPAQTLTTNLFVPLRRRLQCQQPALQALLGILDGILINYIALCLASARKKQGNSSNSWHGAPRDATFIPLAFKQKLTNSL